MGVCIKRTHLCMFLRASDALVFRFFRITALRFLGIEDPHVIQAEARQSAAEA